MLCCGLIVEVQVSKQRYQWEVNALIRQGLLMSDSRVVSRGGGQILDTF